MLHHPFYVLDSYLDIKLVKVRCDKEDAIKLGLFEEKYRMVPQDRVREKPSRNLIILKT